MVSEQTCALKKRNQGFTPLNPEGLAFQSGDEGKTKIKSSGKPRLLRRGVTGFTFIELMVGVSILAFSLTSILLSITCSAIFSKQAKDLTISTEIAESVMEEIFNEVKDAVITIATIQAKDWAAWVDTQGLVDAGSGYSLNDITATLTQDGGFLNLYNVRVTVTWNDNSNTRNIVLNSKVWNE